MDARKPARLTRRSSAWRRCRWGFTAAVLAAMIALIGWQWALPEQMRQWKVLFTIIISGGGLLLLFFSWVVFSSRAPRVRLAVFAAALALLGLGAATMEIRGVTGDFVPLFDWRWSSSSMADSRKSPSPGVPEPFHSVEKTTSTWPVSPGDSPQFLGPRRNAVIHGTRLARDWTARPPRQLWRQEIGLGWSAFAVQAGRAITQEQRGDEELVVAYELATGNVLWSHADSGRYSSTIAGDGPRATPTLSGGRVYALGALGFLNCLDGETGDKIWSRDLLEGHREKNLEWGMACSPLVQDGKVMVSGGGPEGKLLLALQCESGEIAWQCRIGSASYSSPLIANLAGAPQLLILSHKALTAHDPATGQLFWQHDWPGSHPKVSQPVPVGEDRVLISSGYGIGCELVKVSNDGAGKYSSESLWKNGNLKTKFTNSVQLGNFLYGLDDGILVCLDLSSGERRWKAGRHGHGQLLLVEDLLLIQAESGEVVLVEARPEAPRELTRFTALNGKTWNNPTFSPPYLLVRNDREAACYELPLDE